MSYDVVERAYDNCHGNVPACSQQKDLYKWHFTVYFPIDVQQAVIIMFNNCLSVFPTPIAVLARYPLTVGHYGAIFSDVTMVLTVMHGNVNSLLLGE